MIAREAITAVILAGGRAQRLGGVDKSLVRWRGRPLIDWMVDSVATVAAQIHVVSNADLEAHLSRGLVAYADDMPGHPGPLAGIATAAFRVSTPWMLTLPADMPGVPGALLERLCDTLAPLARVHDDRGPEPLLACYRTRVARGAANALRRGEHAVHRWQRRLAPVVLRHPQLLRNLNQWSDFDEPDPGQLRSD